MIAYLKGTLLEKGSDAVIVEAGGVGYEVSVTPGTARALGEEGSTVELFVSESTALYGGGTTLYGFATREEKNIFLILREVPSTGAKKALEHLDKASRSLADFRRAILAGDAKSLSVIFGFTNKTAERLISALKDKMAEAAEPGTGVRWQPSAAALSGGKTGPWQRALDALISLGYKPAESRQTLQTLTAELQGREPSVEEVIRLALKRL